MAENKKIKGAEECSCHKKKKAIVLTASLVASCALLYALYKLLFNLLPPDVVLAIYTVVSGICIVAYFLYNRGFSRRGVTREMLPDSMSDEQKEEFIADGEARIKKSKPLLVVIIGFVFTFLIEAVELFVLPLIMELIGK